MLFGKHKQNVRRLRKMMEKVIHKVISRFFAAVCMVALLSLAFVMPNAKASGCPLYGNHIYNIHWYTGTGTWDYSSHTYTYYQSGGQQFSSSCTYTRYIRQYHAQCACNAINYGITHEHLYKEFHPNPGDDPSGCGSGDRFFTLPNDL